MSARLAHFLWRALTNFGTFRKVVPLLKLPPFAETVRYNPKFAFKYFSPQYLVRGLPVTKCAACFLHHYSRLHGAVPDRILGQLLHWDVELYAFFEGANRFALTLGMSKPWEKEGELSLLLKVESQIVFTLSFTIVPGWVANSKAAEVLLISRLQGTRGCYRQIKLATRAMHGVRPRALLFAALEGIAMALEISEIAAVCATNHISFCEELAAVLKNCYDDFFAELGLAKTPTGFFLTSVPRTDKPISLIRQGHRLQAKKRRIFTGEIRLACVESFLRMTGRSASLSIRPQATNSREEIKPRPTSDLFRALDQYNPSLR